MGTAADILFEAGSIDLFGNGDVPGSTQLVIELADELVSFRHRYICPPGYFGGNRTESKNDITNHEKP